ncbi:MAG: helix-hairpin-helix domain-containing protein [Anaerolineaceae bacterium]|nr:helix-hairpin-helix domain-containing protein [Anaerolineaceae bacterium]
MAEKKPLKTDINLASKDELVAINGIGESLAQKIIDYRPFKTVADLTRVPGISETKLTTLQPYLKAQSFSKTVKPKTAESAPQTSGLGHTEAFVFLEERSDRQDAFLIIFGGFIFGLILLLLRRKH